ncbi:hypothetical protein HPB50_023399 [Hyalomma asiaticum]|uniref:Uncharacterized protein n=1 Tax=Hyalomma asiaticum TaxID=266040 RepID=A0ACB7S2C4_HYAAI|nr:hypothetical protein HPB50_023399 [Hyalomma asiaticum]
MGRCWKTQERSVAGTRPMTMPVRDSGQEKEVESGQEEGKGQYKREARPLCAEDGRFEYSDNSAQKTDRFVRPVAPVFTVAQRFSVVPGSESLGHCKSQ